MHEEGMGVTISSAEIEYEVALNRFNWASQDEIETCIANLNSALEKVNRERKSKSLQPYEL